MTHRTPLITLAAVAAYFVAMLVANMIVHPVGAAADGTTTGPPPAGPSASAAPTSRSAEPSEPPEPAEPSEPEDEDATFPAKAVYVGRAEEGDLAVAIAVLNGRAAAYICDGVELEAWLRGTVQGDDVELTARDGTTIEARLDDGRLEGTVKTEEDSYDFTIREAGKPAGVYRAKGSKTTVGWIVLPDGSQVGLATNSQGVSEPAPELDADARSAEVDGEQLEVEDVTGETEV